MHLLRWCRWVHLSHRYLLLRFAGLLKITRQLQLLANSWLLMLAVWITRHISPPSPVSTTFSGVPSPWCSSAPHRLPILEMNIGGFLVLVSSLHPVRSDQLSTISFYSIFLFPKWFKIGSAQIFVFRLPRCSFLAGSPGVLRLIDRHPSLHLSKIVPLLVHCYTAFIDQHTNDVVTTPALYLGINCCRKK